MKPRSLLKWIGIALGVVILLIAALFAYVAFIFDANAYQGVITGYVADKYQRTLTIDGKLALSVFPRIAVTVPHTTLSEPRAPGVVAEVGAASLSLELWPLLRKEIRVGEIRLDGLKTTLVKGKDGKTNFDDLMGGEPQAPAVPKDGGRRPTVFDVGGLRITNSAVTYRDLAAPRVMTLSKLDLTWGRLADKTTVPLALSTHIDVDRPALAGSLTAQGKVALDLDAKHYGADGLVAKFDGTFDKQLLGAQIDLAKLDWTPERFEAPTLKLALKHGGAQSAEATVTLEAASGTPTAVKARQVALAGRLAGGGRTTTLDLKSPLAANLDTLAATLDALQGRLQIDDPALPVKKIDMPFTGRLVFEAKAEKIDGKLDTKFDESTIAARFAVAGFAKPAIGFDVGVDRINVDQYLAAAPAAGGAAAPAKEEPIDLSALKTLTLDGAARVGNLQVRGIKASNVALKLVARGGELRLAPMTAQLYGGSLDASARVDANGNHYAFAPRLANIQVGPLLHDAAKLDKLEGRGNVTLDVTGTGSTVTAIKRSLAGMGAVRIVDGAIVGFDYGKRLADWRGRLDALRAGSVRNEAASGGANEKTTFSELTASFVIAHGVATNKDLSVKAPLVRLGGAGTIDIGHDSLDYTVRASVVSTLTGQGGKELAQTKDVTIPVRVYGPFDKTAYEIQWAEVSSALIETKKQEVKEKAREQLQEKLKGLFQR